MGLQLIPRSGLPESAQAPSSVVGVHRACRRYSANIGGGKSFITVKMSFQVLGSFCWIWRLETVVVLFKR